MEHTPKFINVLTDAMSKVSNAKDNNEINSIIEELLKDITNAERATLLIFDKEKMTLFNDKDENAQNFSVVGDVGLTGQALQAKKSAIYNHVTSEKHYAPDIDNPDKMRIKGQIIVPLLDDDQVSGIVRVSRSVMSNRNFTKSELDMVKSIDEFLIKIIKILLNGGSNTKIEVNQDEVKEKIAEVEAKRKNDNEEISSTMLFLSNTVHDIRTPANSLYGFLDLMEEQIENERLLEFIANAKESAQFINNLTDSILERVKYEKESSTSEPTTINSIKFFSNVANIFTANMFKKEIHYLIYIDPLIPKEVEIEELKVKRVLINLIGNAYKFTPKDKVIEFRIEYDQASKSLKFSIKDTGVGIAKENQEAIFKAFQQAEADTSIHFGGTGLGLAISAKYVKDLGGKLELESEVDKGSNFYFSIPITVIDETPAHLSFVDTSKFITILTDKPTCIDAMNMKKYLMDLSIPEEKIAISDKVGKSTTHLFCFEHKLSEEVVHGCKEKGIKLVAIEEQLFSITKNSKYSNIKVISENSYYGDVLYSMVSSRRKPRVFIADDNKINVMLLKTILESEYCDIAYALDGQESLDKLVEGLKTSKPYDIIFADKHMPHLSGIEVIQNYKVLEAKYKNIGPIKVISITGDPDISNEEQKLYDLIVSKPFNKAEIRDAFNKVSGIEEK
ncbi:MAG: ATP-binding protein [Campylobacterota bacterium]|nr:ATP-binding protein [Campylobacterota bacterium]